MKGLKRSSGILLHPTSLPGKYGIGDLGAGAYRFVDWLAALCVLIGGLIGGYVGARITRRVPERVLRVGVAGLGLVLTLSFLLR